MSIPTDDTLLAFVNALPAELRTDRQTLRDIHRNHAAMNPDHYMGPMTSAEVADLLGITPNALKTMRCRRGGPPGWVNIPGLGWRYRSRLEVYNWLQDQMSGAA
ncbi:MAG: helix-turn-helix domain-containing protein [Pseudomonadota bacterium]